MKQLVTYVFFGLPCKLVFLCGLLLLLVWTLLTVFPYTETRTLDLSALQHDQGYCYRVPFPGYFRNHLVSSLFTVASDPEQHSTLKVFEDGIPLGPAHSAHGTIRQIGKGSFSHWRDTLYFSASDNSAPRVNGKTYSLVMEAFVPVYVWKFGLLCLSVSLFLLGIAKWRALQVPTFSACFPWIGRSVPWRKRMARVFGLLALLLCAINVTGRVMGERVWSRPAASSIDLVVQPLVSVSDLDKVQGENDVDYIVRATLALSHHMNHYGVDPQPGVPWQQIRPLAAPFLYDYAKCTTTFLQWLFGKYNTDYFEERDIVFNFDRRFGLCGEVAPMLQAVLVKNNIPAATHILITPTAAHVVVSATANGVEYMLDPDYGVVLPFPLAAVRNNERLFFAGYQRAMVAEGGSQIRHVFFEPVKESLTHDVPVYYHTVFYAKWVIPLALLTIASLLFLWQWRVDTKRR